MTRTDRTPPPGETAEALIEKRDCARVPTPEYTVVFDQILGQGQGSIMDISVHGMRMRSLTPVELGAITLSFKLPAFARRQIVYGEVIWVSQDRFISGIRFHLSLLTKLPDPPQAGKRSWPSGPPRPGCDRSSFKMTFLQPYRPVSRGTR